MPGSDSSLSAGSRLLSLDVFRGMTIAAMILVNNPGSWSHIYAPLQHAPWHGWTPTDLVFPFFLFIVGVSIALAMGRRLEAGEEPRLLLPRIFQRSAILFALGLFLSGFPSFDLSTLRIPGVLQRIGVCYLLGSVLFLYTRPRTQLWFAGTCLLIYCPLMTLVPVPGQGAPDIDHQATNLAAYVDRWLMGGHIWKSDYDPEGVLSTIPALVTTLMGTAAGRILRSGMEPERKTLELFLWGAPLVVLGYVWDWFFPINKALWTSSYALFTGGLAFSALALCYWVFDVRGYKRLARPFTVYGVNAITVFVMSGVMARLLGSVIAWQTADGSVTLQSWIYDEFLASWLSPVNASLAYALLWVSGWYVVLAWMHRRGIAIKV